MFLTLNLNHLDCFTAASCASTESMACCVSSFASGISFNYLDSLSYGLKPMQDTCCLDINCKLDRSEYYCLTTASSFGSDTITEAKSKYQ